MDISLADSNKSNEKIYIKLNSKCVLTLGLVY